MKKILFSLLLTTFIGTTTTQAILPNRFHYILEPVKKNPFTSKVIGGGCCILTGAGMAFKLRHSILNSIRNKPANLISILAFPLGITIAGAALWKSAHNEVYGQKFTRHNIPRKYCAECDKYHRKDYQCTSETLS